jgi:hypothetical protein
MDMMEIRKSRKFAVNPGFAWVSPILTTLMCTPKAYISSLGILPDGTPI